MKDRQELLIFILIVVTFLAGVIYFRIRENRFLKKRTKETLSKRLQEEIEKERSENIRKKEKFETILKELGEDEK